MLTHECARHQCLITTIDQRPADAQPDDPHAKVILFIFTGKMFVQGLMGT